MKAVGVSAAFLTLSRAQRKEYAPMKGRRGWSGVARTGQEHPGTEGSRGRTRRLRPDQREQGSGQRCKHSVRISASGCKAALLILVSLSSPALAEVEQHRACYRMGSVLKVLFPGRLSPCQGQSGVKNVGLEPFLFPEQSKGYSQTSAGLQSGLERVVRRRRRKGDYKAHC